MKVVLLPDQSIDRAATEPALSRFAHELNKIGFDAVVIVARRTFPDPLVITTGGLADKPAAIVAEILRTVAAGIEHKQGATS